MSLAVWYSTPTDILTVIFRGLLTFARLQGFSYRFHPLASKSGIINDF